METECSYTDKEILTATSLEGLHTLILPYKILYYIYNLTEGILHLIHCFDQSLIYPSHTLCCVVCVFTALSDIYYALLYIYYT